MIELHSTDRSAGLVERVEARGWAAVQRAAVYFWNACRQAVNVSADPQRRRRKRDTSVRHGGRKGSSYNVYVAPSQPGQPPRKRTGFGQANIHKEFDRANLIAYVGVKAPGKYMLHLDLGTQRIKARPWLKATYDANLATIRALAAP